VSFRVLHVGQPANARDCHLGRGHAAATAQRRPDRLVDGSRAHRANVGTDRLHLDGPRPMAAQQAAVDTRLIVRSRFDEPVILRPIPFAKLPAEHGLVELNRSLRVFGVDLEMNDSSHWESPYRIAQAHGWPSVGLYR